MARKRKKDLPDIHEHPAFRALVADLKQQSPEQVDRCMEYLDDEQGKEASKDNAQQVNEGDGERNE